MVLNIAQCVLCGSKMCFSVYKVRAMIHISSYLFFF